MTYAADVEPGGGPKPVLCPECEAGKHAICTGEALDPETDEIVGCQCEEEF